MNLAPKSPKIDVPFADRNLISHFTRKRKTALRSFRIILAILLAASGNFYFSKRVSAADLATTSPPGTDPDFWNWPAPPSFTNNSGVSVVLDHQNGDWHYYFSPYLNLQQPQNPVLGISQAYLGWDNGNFGFDIGRKIVDHGPGRYGYPVLGPLGTGLAAEGYDQIGYHFTWGNLRAQKFYALVSESSYRMLIGQRATYDLGPFTLGLTEDILVDAQTPACYYIPIPFSPITNTSDNKIGDGDLTWRISNGFKLYGQCFIDDIPLAPDQYDKWPWRCGFQGGFAWQNAFGSPALTLYSEYTRVYQYTYTHDITAFDWTYQGDFMGDLGPDADRLDVELDWKQSPEWQWSFVYQRIRHGEGKIGDQFIYVPGQTVVFLTGIVETTDLLAVGLTRKQGVCDFGLILGLAYVQNQNHVAGINQFEPQVSVNTTLHL